ncbi:hypothetical protein B0T14DRAFT_134029 [Immersiella caudata]|uniref:Uncharacterized protein n=1 Tax=Immersiella caudata TaxID=314043 RepID=A0AA39X4Q9_9PEZI|nr:hypothetical protein B0T14DRAFT_134029 [Immersiella caudata]
MKRRSTWSASFKVRLGCRSAGRLSIPLTLEELKDYFQRHYLLDPVRAVFLQMNRQLRFATSAWQLVAETAEMQSNGESVCCERGGAPGARQAREESQIQGPPKTTGTFPLAHWRGLGRALDPCPRKCGSAAGPRTLSSNGVRRSGSPKRAHQGILCSPGPAATGQGRGWAGRGWASPSQQQLHREKGGCSAMRLGNLIRLQPLPKYSIPLFLSFPHREMPSPSP